MKNGVFFGMTSPILQLWQGEWYSKSVVTDFINCIPIAIDFNSLIKWLAYKYSL